MSFSSLLRVMIVKELRTLMRERGQVIGLVVAVVFGLIWPVFMVTRLIPDKVEQTARRATPNHPADLAPDHTILPADESSDSFQPTDPSAGSPPTGPPSNPTVKPIDPMSLLVGEGDTLDPAVIKGLRWAVIGVGCFGGFFVASALGAAMALGSFAAEKDENTLEVLLATPLSDTRLYLLKYLAVTIPCLAVTYITLLLFAMTAGFWGVARLPPAWGYQLWLAVALAAPAPLLMIAILTGLQVCVSARADSLKGAGQLFGITFMVLVFSIVVIPLLIRYLLPEAGQRAVGDLMLAWFGRPFAVQYVIVIGLASCLALAIFLVGLRLMNRERMLT